MSCTPVSERPCFQSNGCRTIMRLDPTSFTVRPSAKPVYPIYALGFICTFAVFAFSPFEDGAKYLFIPVVVVVIGAFKQFRLQFQSLMVDGGKLRYKTGMLS